MPRTASFVVPLAIGLFARVVLAAPTIVGVAPQPHAISVPADASVVIDFDTALNPASVVPSNIKAWGHWSGMMSGQLQLQNGGTRLRFTPAGSFSAGEIVTVFLGRGIQDWGGQPMARGYSWTFWVRSAPGALLLHEVQRVAVNGPNEGHVQPYGAHGADLDHDGHLDIAMPNGITRDVRVFLNDGAGGYGPWTAYPIPTGSRPSANEATDFNGDGVLDFATGNGTGDSVSVFIGIGDGSFGPVRNYRAASGVRGLAVADVDGDCDLDLITANLNGNNVSVLRNYGDGTFAPRVNIEGHGELERSCAVADADGDGILDLFVGSYGSDELSLLLGDGDGSFTFSSKVPAGGSPWMIAAGDVDGDGNVDVVSANSVENNASVALGDGLGGLSSAVTYATGSFPIAIDLGDIDGDGDLDLVTSDGGSGTWTIYENDGSGGFVNPLTLPGSTAAACATLFDYDNDGDLDLAGIDEADDLLIIFRNGMPLLGPEPPVPPATVGLEQNQPNPFDQTTLFRFRIPARAPVLLCVYDLAGRVVATPVDEELPSGAHERAFDGRGLAGGVYLYRLTVQGRDYTKRMVVVR